jgi:hypothetical protein
LFAERGRALAPAVLGLVIEMLLIERWLNLADVIALAEDAAVLADGRPYRTCSCGDVHSVSPGVSMLSIPEPVGFRLRA